MLELAERLKALNTPLRAALSSPARTERRRIAEVQLRAASSALHAANTLARRLALPARDLLRCAAASELLLDAGRVELVSQLALAASPAVQALPDGHRTVAWLGPLAGAELQLAAACGAVCETGCPNHDAALSAAAAAFAGSTARPAALLPWLGALSRALLRGLEMQQGKWGASRGRLCQKQDPTPLFGMRCLRGRAGISLCLAAAQPLAGCGVLVPRLVTPPSFDPCVPRCALAHQGGF